MISVVIRNKNQAEPLSFLLKNLKERYDDDIQEFIVIDNLSQDNSEEIANQFGAKFISIEKFSYGGSANFAAKYAKGPYVVIFSAHSYPVSHDFFKLILKKFETNSNIAGLRCLHSANDYRNFINKVSAKSDPNRSGLIFSGSAFKKSVWEKHPFREDVATFEDKEWSKRILDQGYDIEFVESVFCYEIKRTDKQNYFRFKNDMVGNYQLWHKDVNFMEITRGFLVSIFNSFKHFFINLFYSIKRYLFSLKFIINKPNKF